MSWPGTDEELRIQGILDAAEVLVAAAGNLARRYALAVLFGREEEPYAELVKGLEPYAKALAAYEKAKKA